MHPRHIPNLITLVRIVLVWPVTELMLEGNFVWSLGLFALAGISDGLDGFLAKHYGWQSRLGSYLDPLADKLLLICCYVAAGWLGLLPTWLVLVVILRDAVIVTGAVAYYFLLHPFEGQPHWSSKINTFLQLALILAVLAHQVWPGRWEIPILWLIPMVLASTLGSGAWYVWAWGTRYVREKRQIR